MKNFILLFLITLPLFAFSKSEGFSVSGKVLDKDQQTLPYVNVLLINAGDSSLVRGSVTIEDGTYVIEDLAEGDYRVMISFVGYQKFYSEPFTLNDSQSSYTVPDVILLESSETLDEFAVVAQKPFIERHLDKLVVNVDNSIVSAGNTALEVLKRSPGVIVDKDGNISLKGKSGVTIMIDDKRTYLSNQDVTNMLKTMPADQIDRIEIITNPSAKYDAAGNSGIINIVMKKNQMLGVNGRINAGYGQAMYARFNGGGNINYRTEKWNFFTSYSLYNNNGFSTFGVTRKFHDQASNDLLSVFDQHQHQKNQSTSNSGKLAIDYYPNKKHSIGFFVNGMANNGRETGGNQSLINDPSGLLLSGSETASDANSKWQNVSANINYKWKIDTLGSEFSANLDYGYFNSGEKQLYTTNYFDNQYQFYGAPFIIRANLPSTVDIKSAKVDYTKYIGKKIKLETGLKTSYVATDNNAQYYNVISNQDIVDTTKTNHFKYTENINAAYANMMLEINDKLSLQAGLRVENTNAKGEQLTTDSTFYRHYTNLFPSGYITWKANKNNELSLGYSRRIDRPDYQALNPFIYFLDPYSYQQGNTLLLPQYSSSYEASHTFMGFLTTSFNYSHTKGVMTQVTSQVDSTHTTFVTTKNLRSQDTWSGSIMVPIPITKWFTSVNYITVYNSRYRGELQGGEFDKSATAFMLNSQNMFNFKKGWSAEITAFYMSKQVYGIFLMKPMSNITLGISKTFAKDRGTIKCSYSDIFWMNRFRGSVVYQNMDIAMDTRYMSRVFAINFSWKFGNSKAQSQRKESGASDEMDRVKKD